MARFAIALLVLSFAVSARAQSVYVAGTIGADVSRVSHTDSNFFSPTPNGSETVSGSLRVGTPIGQIWGVELEFVHSGRSHDQVPVSVLPLAANNSFTAVTAGGFAFTSASTSAIPIRFSATEIRQRHSDLDALMWARQAVGGSVDLVYLGGVAFSRQRVEVTQNFPTILTLLPPVPNGRFQSTTISYGTRPLAGMEARIRFTSHIRLIPGLRLQGIAEGWLLRPYVGLGWFF